MRSRKHRHKESFSVLLISNTGQDNRHFHVSGLFMRLLTVFVLCMCAAFGWLMYEYLSDNEIVGSYVNASEDTTHAELLDQIAEQEKKIQRLEEEKDALDRRNNELTSENKALLAAAKDTNDSGTAKADTEDGTAAQELAFLSRYPYSETGEVIEKYSDEHPYISIDTGAEGSIVAAADGTIVTVGSDDTYPLIIEVEHENGYRTRYMMLQEAEPLLPEGSHVQSGDALIAVGAGNTQLDYQVVFQEKPIDPLIVFEAKG